MDIYLFALLPLSLLSLLERGRHRYTAGFGFLAALAPVVAKGIGSLISHKKQQSAEKKQIEYQKQQAMQEEAQRRAAFEASQNTPQAAMQRMGFNMKLGRLLGAMGGRDKVPPSLLKAYDTARAMQTYTPGAAYVPPPTSGAGIWDVLGGATEALSYLDVNKLKGGGKAPMSPGQPVNTASTFKPTTNLQDYLKKNAWSSGTQDFG